MEPSKAHELHGQLRENAEELNDYIRDLNSWRKDIKKTDEELRKKQHEVHEDYPPIRNSVVKLKQEGENYDNKKPSKLDKDESNTDDEEEIERNMMVKAEMEKDKGNQFFKEGKYDDAIACYTKGLLCDPNNAILPANRAMALMKKGQFAAAESDCTQSITHDPTYTKAFHRRGTCRFALKKYQLARQDFLKVMELDPGNKHAKAELDKLEKIFQSKQSTESPVVNIPKSEPSSTEKQPSDSCSLKAITKPPNLQSKKPLKRITIELADNRETETKISPLEERANAANTSKLVKPVTTPIKIEAISMIAAPLLPPVPHSAFQFLSDWKKLHNFPELRVQYIKQLPPTELPKIFKESLESEIMSDILNVLQKNVEILGHDTILSYLLNIPKVGRFKTIVMFLSDEEKKGIKFLVDGATNGRGDVGDVLRLYGID